MNNPKEVLTLTNPSTGDSLNLSPEEYTLIFDSLPDTPAGIHLTIKLGDFADNQGFPTA